MHRFVSGLFAMTVLAGTVAVAGTAAADRLPIDLKTGANEVSTEDTLPASKIPASEANPPCGTAPNTVEEIGKAVVGMGNLSIGVPLLEASKYVSVDPSILNTLRGLLGTQNGKASCEQVCIELPLNATNVDADGFMKTAKDGAWVKLDFQIEAPAGAAMMEKPKFTKAQNGYVICSLAKNWKIDQDRFFKLKVTFDKK
jgi:hypothetical protein